MRLRTTAGAYAGQVRDYSIQAGRAALATGMAERLDDVSPEPPRTAPEPAITAPVVPPTRKRRHP